MSKTGKAEPLPESCSDLSATETIMGGERCSTKSHNPNFVSHSEAQSLQTNETVNDLLESIKLHAPAILEGLISLVYVAHGVVQSIAREMAPHIVSWSEIDWTLVMRRMEELPEKSKSAMVLAASKGWFFGWDVSLEELVVLVEKMVKIDPSEVDELLVAYYRKNMQSMAHSLMTEYPERAAAIGAAVKAHIELKEEGYLLSIPVFIAQGDGLLTELTGVKSALMRAPKSKASPPELQASESLRELLKADPESLDMVIAFLNLHNQDFLKSANKRQPIIDTSGEVFVALNRHQVMHGESSNYGTELNSLKAFSFLTSVGLHLALVLKSKKRNIPI